MWWWIGLKLYTQYINTYSVHINTVGLANPPQRAVLINSSGLHDFIHSVCWALSGTRSMSLPSNQSRAVILSFSKRRAEGEQARSFSLFAFAVTREWQLYSTSMFIRPLSPFLKPALALYFDSHNNRCAVAPFNIRARLSMFGAAYWSSGAFTTTVWTCEPAATRV